MQEPPAERAQYEFHGTLRARGAPPGVGFINGDWRRDLARPTLNGRPHYIKVASEADAEDFPSGMSCLHVFFDQGCWRLSTLDDWRLSTRDGQLIFAVAHNDAEHPNTVDRADWLLLCAQTGQLGPHSDFSLATEGPNTEQQPFLLEELGTDFFFRVQPKSRRVMWFVDPQSGAVVHSAAKACGSDGGRAMPGRRWCHICQKCVSANNFHSQHLAQLHRPGRPLGLLAIPQEEEAVAFQWIAPANTGGMPLTGYRLSISYDDGQTWTRSLDLDRLDLDEDPGPDHRPDQQHFTLSARIPIHQLADNEQVGSRPTYRFAVAGLNRAGCGSASDASPPLLLDGSPSQPSVAVAVLVQTRPPRSSPDPYPTHKPPQPFDLQGVLADGTPHQPTEAQPSPGSVAGAVPPPLVRRLSSVTERLSSGMLSFLPDRISERLSAALGMDISSRLTGGESNRSFSSADGRRSFHSADGRRSFHSVDGGQSLSGSENSCHTSIPSRRNPVCPVGSDGCSASYCSAAAGSTGCPHRAGGGSTGGGSGVDASCQTPFGASWPGHAGGAGLVGDAVGGATTAAADLDFGGSADMHLDLRELLAFATEANPWSKMGPVCDALGALMKDKRDDSSDDLR